MDHKTLKTLLDVAKGIKPPDLVITNGRVVNIFTNAIEEGPAIVIKDGWIVTLANDDDTAQYLVNAKTIDADGLYLVPGFIDAHTHLDSVIPFHEFCPYALQGGTTTVVTETNSCTCACGMEGVNGLVESTRGYPLRCYFLVPPHTPPFPDMEGSRGLTLREMKTLLKRDDFLGIGESYWTRVIQGDDRIIKQAAYACSINKALDGHSAGARGRRLGEYVITGITSCHESTTVDEAVEKLRYGLHIMIRDGWVRRELEELSGLKDLSIDTHRLMLVSDVFDSVMLLEEGYVDSIVRRAIHFGFSPMEAIKMVTINPAEYYGLRHLGAIAPLRHADILFIKDLNDVSLERVMVNGQIVVEGGKYNKPVKPYHYPESLRRTISVGGFHADDFKVRTDSKTEAVRVITIADRTITREMTCTLTTEGGFLKTDKENDIIPIAVINRHNKRQMGRGFIQGTGIKDGAVATTVIWDTGNILVTGSNEEDMAAAVNRLVELQGGTVIAREGRIFYEFAMPIFGLMSEASVPHIRKKTKELERKIKEIGSILERPFLTIQTIPFTGLPFLRITDKGLMDIRKGKPVPLTLNQDR